MEKESRFMPASEIQRWIPVLQELWLTAACKVLAEYTEASFEVDETQPTESSRTLGVRSEFALRIGDTNALGTILFGVPAASREISELALLGQEGESKEKIWDGFAAKTAQQWLELVQGETNLTCTIQPVPHDRDAGDQFDVSAGLFSNLKSDKIVLPVYLVVELDAEEAPVEAASSRSTDARAQEVVGESAVGETSSTNLDLLLDIELQASLRFGGREMLLSEILDMAPGDVVPLDRSVHAPVDLVIGDRIVARGEVVLVDGNYGLRVTEVAEPRKRLETVRCLF
jgi:flagellar motor switch protein FliN